MDWCAGIEGRVGPVPKSLVLSFSTQPSLPRAFIDHIWSIVANHIQLSYSKILLLFIPSSLTPSHQGKADISFLINMWQKSSQGLNMLICWTTVIRPAILVLLIDKCFERRRYRSNYFPSFWLLLAFSGQFGCVVVNSEDFIAAALPSPQTLAALQEI